MDIFKIIQESINKHKNRNAFYINETFYTYFDFINKISNIRNSLEISTKKTDKIIGLVTNNDIETYASIVALWFEGKAYVPLNPEHPVNRNLDIITQAEIQTIIDSSEKSVFTEYNIINSKIVSDTEINLVPKVVSDAELAYIFFTSGTTGIPKGVTISRANVSGFIAAFNDLGFYIDENDRFLQMFDLTFDLSIMSYLVPILNGACIYTIPKGTFKFNYVFELIDEHDITIALMVPSILHYLRPYFDEIDAHSMKYSLFCGEELPLDVTEEWSRCLPNAYIFNVYGPTENTIFCTIYNYKKTLNTKSYNGVLSIGKPMTGVETIIVDDQNQILPKGKKGELCLAGKLLSPGYWKNEEKNKVSFFTTKFNGKKTRFYKTGDICTEDSEGDIMYIGRLDYQTQIQGFRVELLEVEFHVRSFLENINAVAIAFTNKLENSEIGLLIESDEFDTKKLLEYCNTRMPLYMIPTRINFMKSFPLNSNGKIDRNKLKVFFK